MASASPRGFSTAAAFRSWLERNHDRKSELLVLIYRNDSGRGGITYPEALDEALCFGWIDGVRSGAPGGAYVTRFTPRRARSVWSLVNVAHAKRLIREGRMHPAGLRAFEARSAHRTGIYSFEQRPAKLPKAFEARLRANSRAWAYWISQPPGYRKTATWWVVSAKREETRLSRLATLVRDCACGKKIKPLARP
jgi:uncharacterized protein YdeI (YjbR/CyaY-like superfamily)